MAKKSDPIFERWEKGVPHDKRSVEIYKSISKIDYEECGDSLCFKSGGDGDTGETLMYLLDVHFERLDKKPKTFFLNEQHTTHVTKDQARKERAEYEKKKADIEKEMKAIGKKVWGPVDAAAKKARKK